MDLHTRAGLYVHVPFCRSKCPYCSFFSFIPRQGEIGRYLRALRTQLRQLAAEPAVQKLSFHTLFIGGGTPSILPAEALGRLADDCRTLFSWSPGPNEWTIEVNPGALGAEALRHLRRAGFNRLSIGVQSLNDRELRRIGRIHTADEALRVLSAARRAGFDNLSCDLMYGLPGQTAMDWRRTLERVLAQRPEHLSLYELTVEEGSPLAAQVRRGEVCLPPEDEVLAMMEAMRTCVEESGLQRYEISNYARPGRRCRHNINYWENGEYLGAGPGATAFYDGLRRTACTELDLYCRRIGSGQSVWERTERLDPAPAFRETVIMGLRMMDGVSVAALQDRFGIDLRLHYQAVLPSLLHQQLVTLAKGRFFLTARGLLLANQVMLELV